MPRYAEQTTVSVESSRAEIERTLTRYGASCFMYGWGNKVASIQFEMHDRRVRFMLPLPDPNATEFTHTPGRGLERRKSDAVREWERACRQRWRALSLVIKAKLEAVECGITQFEEEFLAHIVLPNNQTFGDFAIPQIAQAYARGTMPPLLPHLKEATQ